MKKDKYTIVEGSLTVRLRSSSFASYEKPYMVTTKLFSVDLEAVRDWWSDKQGEYTTLQEVLSYQRCLHDEDPSTSLLTERN